MSELDPARQATMAPETSGTFVLADVMAPGFAIEKNPMPMARIALAVPSTETILGAIETDAESNFVPYLVAESEEQTETALTDEERIDLTDILSNGGAIKVLGYEAPTVIDIDKPEQENSKDGFMLAIRKTRVATAASTVAATAVGLLSLFGNSSAEADTTPAGLQGNVPAFAGAQNLLGNQEDLDAPATAEASDDTATTDPSLEQECVQAGTAAPKILKWPTMIHAGVYPSQYTVGFGYAKRHPPQYLEGLLQYSALESPLTPADCAPDYLRQVGSKFFMEKANVHGNPGNPIKNPNNWKDISGGWWVGAIIGAEGQFSRDQNQAATVHILRDQFTSAPYFFNQCINGEFLKVDFVDRNIVTDGQTGQQLGEAYHIYDAKIQGNCEAAATSARIAANAKH